MFISGWIGWEMDGWAKESEEEEEEVGGGRWVVGGEEKCVYQRFR